MQAEHNLSVLVIEDQREIAHNISRYFEQLGYLTDFAYTGTQGLNLALENYYDVIILDVMLPGLDGLMVCSVIRQKSKRHIPIIMLTARDTLDDKIQGFENGADDYLTKPFELKELHLRCLALAKRNGFNKSSVITIGDLSVDLQQQTAHRGGTLLELHAMGFKLLALMAEAYPREVTRSEISQKLWGDEPTESDAIRSHIYQLRTVVDKPFEHAMIKTHHGIGFSLQAAD
ncbi:response regulator transcription factor [Marinicella sp. S1101]|uniref:response regulator transcription factor n=1 Tax=Marinicella marina TaxID=2996016 RepID=UPI0022608923|nr:response regulator transcription factor [Marinicella marina]MCX7554695.1 response regulator transcription factor [Marinicella marina]MDJ1141489.1 response regulator transcription factor [Marinicella marina]